MLFRRRRVPGPASSSLPVHWSGSSMVPADREELASQVASSTDFDVVAESPGRWDVHLFDDVRGLVGDEVIEGLPPRLEALEGVDEAVHVDREVIEVSGSIGRDQLVAFVVAHLAAHGDPDYWDGR